MLLLVYNDFSLCDVTCDALFIFLLYNSLSYTSFFIVGESVIANVKQRQADDTCTEKVT